jgi:hypothetical protein
MGFAQNIHRANPIFNFKSINFVKVLEVYICKFKSLTGQISIF